MEIKVDEFKNSTNEQKDDFWSEFAQGYLDVEKEKIKQQLEEYSKAYDQIKDKSSFNAQYLKTLIDNIVNEM